MNLGGKQTSRPHLGERGGVNLSNGSMNGRNSSFHSPEFTFNRASSLAGATSSLTPTDSPLQMERALEVFSGVSRAKSWGVTRYTRSSVAPLHFRDLVFDECVWKGERTELWRLKGVQPDHEVKEKSGPHSSCARANTWDELETSGDENEKQDGEEEGKGNQKKDNEDVFTLGEGMSVMARESESVPLMAARTPNIYLAKVWNNVGSHDEYENESAMLKKVQNCPGFLKFVAVTKTVDGRPVLITEDVKGIPLDRLIAMRYTFHLDDFLDIAIALAKALCHLHAAQIMHCALSPSSILVKFHRRKADVEELEWRLREAPGRQEAPSRTYHTASAVCTSPHYSSPTVEASSISTSIPKKSYGGVHQSLSMSPYSSHTSLPHEGEHYPDPLLTAFIPAPFALIPGVERANTVSGRDKSLPRVRSSSGRATGESEEPVLVNKSFSDLTSPLSSPSGSPCSPISRLPSHSPSLSNSKSETNSPLTEETAQQSSYTSSCFFPFAQAWIVNLAHAESVVYSSPAPSKIPHAVVLVDDRESRPTPTRTRSCMADTQSPIGIPSPTFSPRRSEYTPPEMCGFVNAPHSYRSELYTLGIIFYEMLAGNNA